MQYENVCHIDCVFHIFLKLFVTRFLTSDYRKFYAYVNFIHRKMLYYTICTLKFLEFFILDSDFFSDRFIKSHDPDNLCNGF